MKYLVTLELIGHPPTSPPELLYHLENRIIPTHEALQKLEAEKKILAGGDYSGRRGTAFIVEAASNEELTQLLMSFPMWSLMKVEVTPLDDFKTRQEMHFAFREKLKGLVG